MKTSPMPVVSDADVIIHLINLKKLSLLQSLYSEISVPQYVENEIRSKESPEFEKAVQSFIKVLATSSADAERIAISHGIHIGESHVKALGELLKAELFLSNERKVRKAAKEEGFKVAGTIGIILKALRDGKLEKAEAHDLLEKMKDEGYRIHPEIVKKAQTALKEL